MKKIIGDYVLVFILFGAMLYFLLPILTKRHVASDQRLRKAMWGALLFAVAKVVVDYIFP